MGVNDERPREVFLDACLRLARYFELLGFRYASSRQRMRRDTSGVRDLITFQSSHSNAKGLNVAIWPFVLAENADYTKWRAAHGLPARQFIGGGQIGNLAGTGWRDWNLADPLTRDVVIDEIREALAQVALPWFDLVKARDRLVEAARQSDTPGLDIEELIPWLTFVGSPREEVADVTESWLRRWGVAGPGSHRLARVRPVVDALHIPVVLPWA